MHSQTVRLATCDPARFPHFLWIPIHVAAKRLDRSRRMVRYLASSGRLDARKIGCKLWWIRASDVDRYLAEQAANNV